MVLHEAEQISRVAAGRAGLRVVSIDLFDTLVFRRTFDPLDCFYLQHTALHEAGLHKGQAAAWVRLRKDVEHALAAAAAPHEVTLAQIYAALRPGLGWSAEQAEAAMAMELAIEADVITPFGGVVAALAQLHRSGIAIVVQTDTYLPATFIRRTLDAFLDFPYELRCSSETGAPKRSGLAFARLRQDFGKAVVHFGDNHAVDVVLARKAGIAAHQVRWPRAELIEGSLQKSYADTLGARRVATPADGGFGSDLRALAFRWSLVLADFVMAVREHADEIAATDIWLLSRDCETISAVVQELPHLLGQRTVRYVDCSRSSCHPILAVTDPERFASWGYQNDDEAIASGRTAIAYYNAQLGPHSRKVLIVDTGWKGRLQVAIASAVPQVEVHGFYFSLEDGAEPDAAARAATFLPWEPRTFVQAVVEALAGFERPSCRKFAFDASGAAVPVYKAPSADRSPAAYCEALRTQLPVLLSGIVPGGAARGPERLAMRRKAVAQICAYPDATVIGAFRDWGIGIGADDSEVTDLLSGGTASKIDRLLGRPVRGNLWPRASVWSVTSRPALVRAIHYADNRLAEAKSGLKRVLKRSPAGTGTLA